MSQAEAYTAYRSMIRESATNPDNHTALDEQLDSIFGDPEQTPHDRAVVEAKYRPSSKDAGGKATFVTTVAELLSEAGVATHLAGDDRRSRVCAGLSLPLLRSAVLVA